MELLARFTIPGNSPRKSNSRQLVTINDHPASIKSAKARAFVDVIRQHTPKDMLLCHEGPVLAVATLHYSNERSDLSLELVQDALQVVFAKIGRKRLYQDGKPVIHLRGVYVDDNQIYTTLMRKHIDKKDPMVEISFYALPSPEPWRHIDHDTWADLLVRALEAAL